MKGLEIVIEIQQPTEIQKSQHRYIIRHKMILQEAENFKKALYRLLNDKLDLEKIIEKEYLLIKYKRTDRCKIEYQSIKNKSVRSQIRRTIESSVPIIY